MVSNYFFGFIFFFSFPFLFFFASTNRLRRLTRYRPTGKTSKNFCPRFRKSLARTIEGARPGAKPKREESGKLDSSQKCQNAGLQTPDRIIGLGSTREIMRLIGLEPTQRKSGRGLGGVLPDFQAKNWDFLTHLALLGDRMQKLWPTFLNSAFWNLEIWKQLWLPDSRSGSRIWKIWHLETGPLLPFSVHKNTPLFEVFENFAKLLQNSSESPKGRGCWVFPPKTHAQF